jgi:catechol 2,3-dioxygenase-like lactoylglutathione lyase family enzyme
MAHGVQVTFDCADPDRLARFWAEVLGYKVQDPPPGYATWPEFLAAIGVPESEWTSASAVVDPEGQGVRIFFQRVPEPKSVKNRVHLDVNVGGGHATPLEERRARVDAEAARLATLGATIVGGMEKMGEYWVVLRDPEGNELCLQ